MVSLYGTVEEKTFGDLEYILNEYYEGVTSREKAENALAQVISQDGVYNGSPEYLAWYLIAVAREVVFPPYGVACSDGVVRLGYRFVGSMTAEEEARRTSENSPVKHGISVENGHGCKGVPHRVGVWNLDEIRKQDLTAPAPKA